jgi:uncharacterized RDD family membrane protein YckC
MAEEVSRTVRLLDTATDIETPEHIRFRYQLAGPARRAFAYAIDLVVKVVIGAALLFAATISGIFSLEGVSQGLLFVALFVIEWGYFVLFESMWNGTTIGKRAANLRVVKEGGYPITFTDAVLRNLLRGADFLPSAYAVGLLAMISDGRFRRLGDRVAGTMVVVEERKQVARPVVLQPPPTREEIESLPRPRLGAADLEAIELFLRRRETLSPARELELAEMVAPLFAARFRVHYRNPSRFLALLYERATSRERALAHSRPPPPPAWGPAA